MDVISLILPAIKATSPLLHIQTSLPPSPTSVPVPPKRLRSCLSPSRRRPSPNSFGMDSSANSTSTMDHEPSLTCSSSPSPMTSRSTSFSSQVDDNDCWRRGRSVRWDESEGCIMAAYYSTWSSDDYDRSPLEPPKPEERACLMPARGSRCLSPLDCFADVNPDDAFFPRTTYQPLVAEPLPVIIQMDEPSSPSSESSETETEDKEWEECMERRRMMFAQMSRPATEEVVEVDKVERRFEGYTSISANLVALLAEAGIGSDGGARDVATPVGTPVELEDPVGDLRIGGSRPKLVRVEHRLRRSISPEEEHVEEADEEEEAEDGEQPSPEMVFAMLRAMRMGPGRDLRTGAEERETVE